jgi:hypothetical protein
MNDTNRFRLSARGMMLAMISAALSGQVLATPAKVDFAVGDVTATGADGRSRQLVKGAEVQNGDAIDTKNGRAQIRFPDGAYVSLQPNTQFGIKDFVFEGKTDGSEKAFFSLLKGALRTVTGLVGRTNRDKYQIATPTATIGIRGTGGLIQVGADGSTLIAGSSGVWTLTNAGGTIDVPAGTSGFAGPNTSQPPQQTTQGPSVPPPQAGGTQQQPTFSTGDSRNSSGNSILFTPLQSGSNYAIADGGEGGSIFLSTIPANAKFNSLGMLTSYDNCCGGTVTLRGSHAEFGTVDGVLAWGRWIGNVDVAYGGSPTTYTYTPNQGWHYVVGVVTPVASLPGGVTYTYNLIGATSPTLINGASAPGTLTSGTLSGDFLNSAVNANFGGTIGGKTFNATASGSISGATFSGSGTYSGTLQSEGGSFINGFFAGSGATHAGMSYLLTNTSLGSNVVGAAAFKFSSSAPSILP